MAFTITVTKDPASTRVIIRRRPATSTDRRTAPPPALQLGTEAEMGERMLVQAGMDGDPESGESILARGANAH